MQFFGETLTVGTIVLLVFAVGLTLFFEAINGFHDTANAVATVIYTNSLEPTIAVVWSGICNLVGALMSSGAVAFTIWSLLPVDLVINIGSGLSYAMLFCILISAIIWNFGTWYLGIPNSSTHTLVGSIVGVSIVHSVLSSGYNLGESIDWKPVREVLVSLLISPIIGFCCAALLLLLAKALLKNPDLYQPADEKKTPPLWIRALLILTCTGVSFSHGSNDGQKGMGLLMMIFIAILPGIFALNMYSTNVPQLVTTSRSVTAVLEQHTPRISLNDRSATNTLTSFLNTGKFSDQTYGAMLVKTQKIADSLSGKTSFKDLSIKERRSLRSDMDLVSSTISKLNQKQKLTDRPEKQALTSYQTMLEQQTKYLPRFVKIAVAFALGVGTMIGWKRIVITVGEKIGKKPLSYGQGASAELVTMATIGAASSFGLPASTTHVLSSGVAGTMVADGAGLQWEIIRNIALAWVLTLPASGLVSAALFAASSQILLPFLAGLTQNGYL